MEPKIDRRMKGRLGPAKAINALREHGFEVHVTIRRCYERGNHSVTDGKLKDRYFGTADEAKEHGFDTSHVQPCGGSTMVSIWHPVREVGAVETADCTQEDNFNRRRGLRMALGRALKTLEQKEAARV